MAYNANQTRTWDRSTPRDGLLFEAEFNRVYGNTAYLKEQTDSLSANKANSTDVSTALSLKLNTSDVQDNLTSVETAKPSSARAVTSLLMPGFVLGRLNYYNATPTIIRVPKWNLYEVGKKMVRIESELTLDFSTTSNIYKNDGTTPIVGTSETQSKHLYLRLSDTGSLDAMIIPDLDLDLGSHTYLANPKLVKDALSASPAIFDISKNGYYKNSKRIIATLMLNASNQIEFVYELGFGHRYMDIERYGVSEVYKETRWLREHPNCLVADGSTLTNMSTEYPQLYKYLGTNILPNWIDRVPRGIAIGGSRAIRDTQEDAFQGFSIEIFDANNSGGVYNAGGGAANQSLTYAYEANLTKLLRGNVISDGTNGTPRTSNETRMKNFAVSIQLVRG